MNLPQPKVRLRSLFIYIIAMYKKVPNYRDVIVGVAVSRFLQEYCDLSGNQHIVLKAQNDPEPLQQF